MSPFRKRFNIIAPFLFIITALLALIHYSIVLIATRSLEAGDPFRTVLAMIFAIGVCLMPTGLLLTMSPWRKRFYFVTMTGYFWMGFFPIVWFFSWIEFIVAAVYPHPYSYWIIPASTLIAFYALFNGLRQPRVVRLPLKGPAFLSGVRLVQVSDLHVGMFFLKEKWLCKVCNQLEEVNPDLIAITGDLTDGAYEEVAPMLAPLERLHPPLGKFYITGNHEYIREGEWEARLRNLGFAVLHNSNKVIPIKDGKLMIAGVPDHGVDRFRPGLQSEPDMALKGSRDVDYRILMAHQPRSALDIANETCDLVLAGHTHAGQIFPFRLFVRLQQPMVSGFKQLNNVLVFAHQGTGHWGPPMRWFTRSEIVVFEWQ